MNRRILAATMAVSMSVCASHALAQAFASAPAVGPNATSTSNTTTTAMPHGKQIGFHLRNDSSAPVTIQAGAQQITIAPGKSVGLKLPAGTQVTTTTGTAHVTAGGILATVDANLSGNTLVIS